MDEDKTMETISDVVLNLTGGVKRLLYLIKWLAWMCLKILALLQHLIFIHTSASHIKMSCHCHCCFDRVTPFEYNQKNMLHSSSSILPYCFFSRSVCVFAVGTKSSASFSHLCSSLCFDSTCSCYQRTGVFRWFKYLIANDKHYFTVI